MMQNVLLFLCLILIVFFGALTMMWHSMLKSAIALALTSAFLAICLFLMGLPWAALFELSVCAGLITAVFVSAISLTVSNRRSVEHTADHRKRFAVLPFLLIACGLAIIAVTVLSNFQIDFTFSSAATFAQFKELFWNTRQVDILGQIIVVLAGAFAVVVLFKDQKELDIELKEESDDKA